MDSLELFYRKIPDYDRKTASELIIYLAYYCAKESPEGNFTVAAINNCFDELCLKRYSNVSGYLSSKTKGNQIQILKDKKGYKLSRYIRDKIESELKVVVPLHVSAEFFDLNIIEPVRDNTKPIAIEMCQCYMVGAFTAGCVMMRRLLETLIIDCFESHQCQQLIKTVDNNYMFLSELIPAYLSCSEWSHSKNIPDHLKQIKKLGDQSAHNRFFIGRQSDMDNIQAALRQSVEEIVYITDYPTWNKRLREKKNKC